MYPAELLALHGTTWGKFTGPLVRRRELYAHGATMTVEEMLAAVLDAYGRGVLGGDRSAFRRLRDLRSAGLSEWSRTHVVE